MKNFTLINLNNSTLKLMAFVLCCFSLQITSAQCDTAVDTIDDDFESYDAGVGEPLPDCWSSIAPSGMVIGNRNTGGEAYSGTKYISAYVATLTNQDAYIISPKLGTLDGNHEADFYIKASAGGSIYQLGTMSDPADSGTFTPLGAAAALSTTYAHINTGAISASTDEYFAIKVSAAAPHTVIRMDDFKWQSKCASPATGLNEDFENYTAGNPVPSSSCWTTSTDLSVTNVGIRSTAGNSNDGSQYFFTYTFFSNTGETFIISPQIDNSEIDGNYVANFHAYGSGTVTYELGMMTDPGDTNTFTALGGLEDTGAVASGSSGADYAPITSSAPANANNGDYFAIKISQVGQHSTFYMDSFRWVLASSLSAPKVEFADNFKLFPNPSSDKQVFLSYDANNLPFTNNKIFIYAATGLKVFETSLDTNTSFTTKPLNLSSLSSGVYVLQVTSGGLSTTKKLILN